MTKSGAEGENFSTSFGESCSCSELSLVVVQGLALFVLKTPTRFEIWHDKADDFPIFVFSKSKKLLSTRLGFELTSLVS